MLYLNAPLAYMAGDLLHFRPFQRCPNGTAAHSSVPDVPCSALRTLTYSRPIFAYATGVRNWFNGSCTADAP